MEMPFVLLSRKVTNELSILWSLLSSKYLFIYAVIYCYLFLATDPEDRVRFPALPEKKVVGVKRGPLSLVSTTEELLDRKVAVYKTENAAVGIRHADHVAPSIRKSWQSLRRQAAVARSV
jgi:hypothetical protein